MEILKKYWYVALLLVATAVLALSSFVISNRLRQQEAVNRPEPQAATPECTLTFTISPPLSGTPSPTPLLECVLAFALTIPSATPTNTPPPTNTPVISNTPTNTPLVSNTPTQTPTNTPLVSSTPTNTPRPTATPAPGACNYPCSSNADCGNNLICSSGYCRNPDCSEQPNCACYFVPTPKVPVTGTGTTLLGIAVVAGGIILLLLGLVF